MVSLAIHQLYRVLGLLLVRGNREPSPYTYLQTEFYIN